MAEKVNIASLTINFNDVIKKSSEVKKQIDDLVKSQKILKDSGKGSSEQFVKNAATLKNLGKAYRDNQQLASSLENANKDLIKTMSAENKTRQELLDSRRDLNQIVKGLSADTEEEIEQIDRLNAAIDLQTKKIRGSSSEFNESKDRIGEYKDSIIEAFNALKIQESTLKGVQKELEANLETVEEGTDEYEQYSQALVVVNNDLEKVTNSLENQNEEFDASNLSIQGFIDSAKETGGAGKFIGDGAKAGAKGLLSMTKAALAFALTPLGLVIVALVAGFLLIKNAMNRSEESTNKVKKAFAAFSGIVKGVLAVLAPLGDFLIDVLVSSLELVEKGIFKAMSGIARALEFLGFDKQAESLRNFTSDIEAAAEVSRELVQAELELDKALRIARKTQLDFLKDAEKLRQIRDDESKSIQERIQANEDLGSVLAEQLKIEEALIQKSIDVAELRIKADGETKEALDERALALTELADLQERIVGQESEQIVNRVSLLKEASEKALETQRAELDLFIESQGIKAKTLKESLDFEREIAAEKIDLIKKEAKLRKDEQAKTNAEILKIQNDLLIKQAELTSQNAARELSDFLINNQTKLRSDEFLSEQSFNLEKERLDLINQTKQSFNQRQLELGILNQDEFNDAINQVNEENRIANEELEITREEARIEKEALDAENKLAAQAEQFQNEFAIRQEELDLQRKAELNAAKKTGANKLIINKKFDTAEKILSKDLADFKLQQNAQLFSGIAGLLGESSALGKAFAIAEIINNTAQNAAKAFNQAKVFLSNPVTAGLAPNAIIQGGLIIGIGAAQVAKTAGLKLKKGGRLKGPSHASGGIQTPFGEVEGEESLFILNKKSTSMFAPLLSAINVAGGGDSFADGAAFIGSTSLSSSSLINYDLLAAKIGEQFILLPRPIVGVDEITRVLNDVEVVEQDASI